MQALAEWSPQAINDHLQGRVGVGVVTTGTVSDSRGTRPAVLRAYCADNSTTVNVEWVGAYFSLASTPIRYTLDGGPIQRGVWAHCQGGRCAGLWNGQGIPFLKSLIDKKELRMVFDRRHLEPANATFEVEGAKTAFAEIGEKCGWLKKGE